MIDYSFGYETNDGHHGLGTSEAAPPVAFTVRRHDTENPNAYEEIVYRPERTCHITDVHDFRDGSRTFFLSCGHQRHGRRGTRFHYCDICGAKVVG